MMGMASSRDRNVQVVLDDKTDAVRHVFLILDKSDDALSNKKKQPVRIGYMKQSTGGNRTASLVYASFHRFIASRYSVSGASSLTNTVPLILLFNSWIALAGGGYSFWPVILLILR